MSEKQLYLFRTSKPLLERFGNEFFKSAPRAPGVYIMAASDERVLYVGQSSNLRRRLAFYKNIQMARARGKLRHLVTAIHSITWQVCATAQQARLRENEMLRLHRPRHNVVNARPGSYPFVGVTFLARILRLRLSFMTSPEEGETMYGVFKNRGGAIRSFAGLCRLLWANQIEPASIYEFSSRLLRNKAPRMDSFELTFDYPVSASLAAAVLKGFFLGESDALIGILECEFAQWRQKLDCFGQAVLTNDLLALREFYQGGPLRNAVLRARHEISDPLIGPEEIDDLIVLQARR